MTDTSNVFCGIAQCQNCHKVWAVPVDHPPTMQTCGSCAPVDVSKEPTVTVKLSVCEPTSNNAHKAADGEGTMRIGAFTISVFPSGGYWIRHASGEGGQFKAELLEKAIADFYNKYF